MIAYTGPDGIYRPSNNNENPKECTVSSSQQPTSAPTKSQTSIKEESQNIIPDMKKAQTPLSWNRKSIENMNIPKNLNVPINNQPLPSPGVHSPSDLRHSSNINQPELSQDTPMTDQLEDFQLPRSKNWRRRQVRTSCLTHCIFITNPIFPGEHTTLITSHEARIK